MLSGYGPIFRCEGIWLVIWLYAGCYCRFVKTIKEQDLNMEHPRSIFDKKDDLNFWNLFLNSLKVIWEFPIKIKQSTKSILSTLINLHSMRKFHSLKINPRMIFWSMEDFAALHP